MQRWEYNLVPKEHSRSYQAELMHLAMLLVLLVLLLQASGIRGEDRYFYDALGQLTNYFVPAALAMLLAMRCGVLDLSVWMSWSAGSVVAATILHAALPGEGEVHAGYWPLLAFLAAAAAGAAIGKLNSFLVQAPKMPAVLATALTAVLVWGLLQLYTPDRAIEVHPRAFDAWHVEVTQPQQSQDGEEPRVATVTMALPLSVTRMLGVAIMLAIVLLVVLFTYARTATAAPDAEVPSRVRWSALVAGGTISALGGALWLPENGYASIPQLPVHDLRIPVAAVLAGGIVLAGKGRVLLACLCLPVTMLIATQWYLCGWDLNVRGYALHLLVLLAMAVLASLSLRAMVARHRTLLIVAAISSVLAVMVLAASCALPAVTLATVAQWVSLGLAAAATATLAAGVAQTRSFR